MHSDVFERLLNVGDSSSGGMSTLSTARPSSRRINSLIVPSLDTDTLSVCAGVGSVIVVSVWREVADTVNLGL
jgi:hypothetical protein